LIGKATARVRYAVGDARIAGFAVGEDLSVINRSTGGSGARQVQAQAVAAEIRQRAVQLVALDQQVADKVTEAMAGIRDTFPQNPAPGKPPHTRDPSRRQPHLQRKSTTTAAVPDQ
jgi:hypothetical protein